MGDTPEITRVAVLLLYLYQKVQGELDKKQGPNGELAVQILKVGTEVKTVIQESVGRLHGHEINKKEEVSLEGDEFLMQLLGAEKFKKIKQ